MVDNMESTSLLPPELLKQAEQIQYNLSHPNPHYSVNAPMLPMYLGTIFPLHPLNKILRDLNLVKILNSV